MALLDLQAMEVMERGGSNRSGASKTCVVIISGLSLLLCG